MNRLAAITLCAGFALASALGRTENYSAYMLAKGAVQGILSGAGRSKRGTIPILKFSLGDMRTANGRPGETEISVEFEGLDSLQFKRAYDTNETLKSVEIDVVETIAIGSQKVHEKITLTNALVKSLVQSYANGKAPIATMTFTYQKLEIALDGHTVVSDSTWRV